MVEFEEYVTQDGDMIDLIAFKRFGASSPMTEEILAANPGLADVGATLPAGTVVRIPVPGIKDRVELKRLWE